MECSPPSHLSSLLHPVQIPSKQPTQHAAMLPSHLLSNLHKHTIDLPNPHPCCKILRHQGRDAPSHYLHERRFLKLHVMLHHSSEFTGVVTQHLLRCRKAPLLHGWLCDAITPLIAGGAVMQHSSVVASRMGCDTVGSSMHSLSAMRHSCVIAGVAMQHYSSTTLPWMRMQHRRVASAARHHSLTVVGAAMQHSLVLVLQAALRQRLPATKLLGSQAGSTPMSLTGCCNQTTGGNATGVVTSVTSSNGYTL